MTGMLGGVFEGGRLIVAEFKKFKLRRVHRGIISKLARIKLENRNREATLDTREKGYLTS